MLSRYYILIDLNYVIPQLTWSDHNSCVVMTRVWGQIQQTDRSRNDCADNTKKLLR